jgi:hypothetical protein
MSKEALPELVLQNEKIEGIVQHIENGERSDHDSHAGVNDNYVRYILLMVEPISSGQTDILKDARVPF